MEYIILIAVIFSLSLPIANFFKIKIEKAIPITVVFIIVLIYIAGLFDNLNLGLKIVQAIFVITIFYNLIFFIKLIKNRTIYENLKRIITPGLLIFIGLILCLIILNHNRLLEEYDEFNHWALIVKNMYINNAYGTIENSIVTFNEYPPFTAIFQYFLLKINGAYSEDLIIIAQGILYISMIIPICNNVDFEKNFKNLILIIPSIIILPLIFYRGFFINILVDGFLGILFGIGLFIVYKDTNFYRNIFFIAILISLILTKTTGLFFASCLLVFKFIKAIRKKENIKIVFLFFLIVMIFIFSWNIKVSQTKATREWSLNLKENYEMYESYDEFEKNVTSNFIDALYLKCGFTERNLTLVMCLGLMSIYSIYVYKFAKDKMEYRINMIEIVFSFVIFCIGLLVMYINIFDEKEAIDLAAFERYLSTILLAWTMFNFIVLVYENDVKLKTFYVFLVIIIIFMPLEHTIEKYVNKNEYINKLYLERSYYTHIKDYENVLTKDDKVLFVADIVANPYIIIRMNRYETMGTNINIINTNIDFLYSLNAWNDALEKSDYVYIYSLENTNVFGSKVENKSLYKVNKNDYNNLKLEKVL